MLTKIEKAPKIALCRACRGTGYTLSQEGESRVCALCEGSGRVMVSCRMTVDIRPYREKRNNDK